MIKHTYFQSTAKGLAGLLVAIAVTACNAAAEDAKAPQTVKLQADPAKAPDVVYLPVDSPKKAYIKTAPLNLSRYPLLEPLAGKMTYSESLTSQIRSSVAGRVINKPIALGTTVQTGTMLLELDSPDVADAEADFNKAEADVMLTSKAFNRQQELYAGKAVSRRELEQAQDDLSRSNSELQRTKNRLKNLHINAGQSDGHFALRSPVHGIVVERNVTPGTEVRPDSEGPLFVISDLKHLTVLMSVFEVNISKIKLAQKVSVTVPAYPNEVFYGTVHYISQIIDENTRTVQVRCDLPNPDGRLLPGMYATITIESAPDDQAIVIPLTAIFTEDNTDYVFISLDENRYQQRPVKLGLRLKDRAVIFQGLQAGEQLVTEGALMLRVEEERVTDARKP